MVREPAYRRPEVVALRRAEVRALGIPTDFTSVTRALKCCTRLASDPVNEAWFADAAKPLKEAAVRLAGLSPFECPE